MDMEFFAPLGYELDNTPITATYNDFLYNLEENIIGQDDALPEIAYDIYSYIKSIHEERIRKHNFILCGPSASGKTELFRTVKKILAKYETSIPVLNIDISGFSPSGFVGPSLSSIPEQIAAQGSFGPAIVFLDEFDKILIPLLAGNNEDFHSSIQYELLAMLEGKECTPSNKPVTTKIVDTNKTLFIAMGAFTDFRNKKKEQSSKTGIGFHQNPTANSTLWTDTLCMEDLLRAGGKTELLGRFDCLYNFHRMDSISFEHFFDKAIEALSIEQQILITATDNAYDSFFSIACSEFGCREVKRVLYQTVKHCLMDAVAIKNRTSLRIVVDGINAAKLELREH